MEETKERKTNGKSYKVIGKIILWQTFREETDFKTFVVGYLTHLFSMQLFPYHFPKTSVNLTVF